MPKLYTKKRVNFSPIDSSDIPRYQYHHTLRQAIELSATSYSYQEGHDGKPYQWDNIAPEVALVILQDAEKSGVWIEQEVIEQLGSADVFNAAALDSVLDTLNNNPDYSLFTQKLALRITGKQLTQLTHEELELAGITTVEQFDKVYSAFLLEQDKLTKNFPNFEKVKDSDDYNQLLDFLVNNPLYDKFLKSFTTTLANEFNRNRATVDQVQAPQEISKQTLLHFFTAISCDLRLKAPPSGVLEKNTLYLEIIDDLLYYTVIAPDGEKVTASIRPEQLSLHLDKNTSEDELREALPLILRITAQRGHTCTMAFHSTASLKAQGIEYLAGDTHHDLFLSHLPAVDLVKDEANKFCIYQWLQQGNLPRLKSHIAEGACLRYFSSLERFAHQAKEPFTTDEEFIKQVDSVSLLMREIVELIASLDTNPNETDNELDEKLLKLVGHLSWLKEYYGNTPLIKSGESFPSTEGNFDDFVRKMIFNSTNDKVVRYVIDPMDSSDSLRLNLVDLVNALVNGSSSVQVRQVSNKKMIRILGGDQGNIPPLTVFREQMKEHVSTQLKSNTHHYYTVRSYENDQLELNEAPMSFRGGNLTNTLEETRAFAKKITRSGEFSADSHLFIGQENNIKKHEVRSATAANSLAATGVDGTRSATDKLDVAIQYGGDRDVKIIYILRGKEAFHSHSYLDPLGKNKMSEIAFTHVNPSDYVMTIIYDRNNTILDVIPGNLTGEIHGVSDFTRKVLEAGIEFYNVKHNPNYAGSVKLPNPAEQLKTPTIHLHKKKSLIDIIQSHKSETRPKKDKSTKHLSSVRIRRGVTIDGYKHLSLDTLREEVQATDRWDKTWTFPTKPFNPLSASLTEVRAEAQRHYNMRHVLTLKDFTGWSERERKLQEAHNRILQPGFMAGDIDTQLAHAQVAREAWLTDVLVPKMQTALLLHIAARLITDYRVDVEDLNQIAQKLQLLIYDKHTSELMEYEHQIMRALDIGDESGQYQECMKKAKARMTTIYPMLEEDSYEYYNKFTSCFEMEKNKLRKQSINKAMTEFLDKYLDVYTEQNGLKKKTVYPLADNHDFVFLGPAASGKSTISSQYINREDRKDYVSLATDDYRGVFLPFTEGFEDQKIEQVFIRTQDSAFLISEIVEDRMKAKTVERANVIVDGVTYKPSHRELVEKNNNSIVVCACLDDMSLVVRRSYERAMQEDAGSADKGRHVNTSSLINMHKTASLNLIRYCTPNSTIRFYDTNIPKGTVPPLIATVDTHGTKTLTISEEKGALVRLASFFNKARVNIGAKSDDSLFFKKLKKAEFQVDSLFAAMNFGYQIVLNGENQKPCLTVKKETDGQIVMEVNDVDALKKKMSDSTEMEKELLATVIIYGHYGSLKEVHKQRLLHDISADMMAEKFLASLPEQVVCDFHPESKRK